MEIFNKQPAKPKTTAHLLTADKWLALVEENKKKEKLEEEKKKARLLEVYRAQGILIVESFQRELQDGKNPWGDMSKLDFDFHDGSYNFPAFQAAATILTELGFPTIAVEKEVSFQVPSHREPDQTATEKRSILEIQKPREL